MIVTTVFYAVKCNRCGEIHDNEYSYFMDKDSAIESAYDDEWIEEKGKHYCPGCYVTDEESDKPTIKPPYPDALRTLRSFIDKIMKYQSRLKEKDDRFVVSFYTRVGEKRLKEHEYMYITRLLGSDLILFEYKEEERISNSECVITVRK